MKIVVTRGEEFLFFGKNRFGWWVGINFVPRYFGIMLCSNLKIKEVSK